MLQRGLVTLIKALFRKYIRCLSVNGFKFMDISLSHVLSSLLLSLLPHDAPILMHSLSLDGAEGIPERTLIMLGIKREKLLLFFFFLFLSSEHTDHCQLTLQIKASSATNTKLKKPVTRQQQSSLGDRVRTLTLIILQVILKSDIELGFLRCV